MDCFRPNPPDLRCGVRVDLPSIRSERPRERRRECASSRPSPSGVGLQPTLSGGSAPPADPHRQAERAQRRTTWANSFIEREGGRGAEENGREKNTSGRTLDTKVGGKKKDNKSDKRERKTMSLCFCFPER